MNNQSNLAEETNAADASPPPLPEAPAGIPFVMTNDMKAKLAALGWITEAIADMTPGEGHKLIGDGTAKPAQSPQAPGPYAQVGARLIERGYCALRVPRGLKHPNIKNWLLTYTHRKPTQKEIDEWSTSGAGVGFVTGLASTDVVGVDIDTDDPAIVAAILAVLPTNGTIVKKRGQKGFTIFGRCPGLKDKAFNIDGARICDVLANGRFCVLPATVHPDTNQPYQWLTPDALEDTDPSELPEFPADIAEWIAAALIPFGYSAEPERAPLAAGSAPDADNPWRSLNEAALANLSKWVPELNLCRCRRKSNGYEAVGSWVPSGHSPPLPDPKRPRNLSITSKGIVDFGDGNRGYSPIDLVMAARDCDFDSAFCWLEDRVDPSNIIIDLKPKAKTSMTYASLDEAEAAAAVGQRAVMYAGGAYGVIVDAAETKATAEIIALFPGARKKPDADRPADNADDKSKQTRAGAEFSRDNPDRHYLGTGRSSPKPFPIDALDDHSAQWCKAQALSKGAPVDHAAVALITVAAGCILNRRWVRVWDGFTQPANLWGLSIAKSGDGKTPSQEPAMKFLRTLETEAYNRILPEYNVYLGALKKSQIR
jgi:hypothetical protein